METRLAKLERTDRWLIMAISGLFLLAIVGWTSQSPPKVIRAQSFVLVDSAGHELGALTTNDGHPGLMLSTAERNGPSVTLLVQDSYASIMLQGGAEGNPKVFLTADSENATLGLLGQGSMEATVIVLISNQQDSTIGVHDGIGRPRILMNGNTGKLLFLSEEGERNYELPPPATD